MAELHPWRRSFRFFEKMFFAQLKEGILSWANLLLGKEQYAR